MDKNNRYIIADHIKAVCFLIGDGVKPAGKQQGYVLRKLMRRIFSSSLILGTDILNQSYITELVDSVLDIYKGVYPELENNRELIIELLNAEANKYTKAIDKGQKEWSKLFTKEDLEIEKSIFDLYQTHGVPLELSYDILTKHSKEFDSNKVDSLINKHQQNSKDTSGKQFKSGLGEDSFKTTRLHTTTHLVHQSLREMFGEDIRQKGSAITNQKARFDYSFERKLEEAEIEKLIKKVQTKIDKHYQVTKKEMSPKEARELGAIGLFGEKYGETVTVYSIGEDEGEVLSREFCGGPHVNNTSEIGNFKVLKQKSVGAGIKRIEFDVE